MLDEYSRSMFRGRVGLMLYDTVKKGKSLSRSSPSTNLSAIEENIKK